MSEDKLRLAKEQLAKVQVAAWDPVDWMDLSLYAFYTLGNAVVAAAQRVGVPWKQTHPSKVDAARELHSQYGLPDIADLLSDLNAIRKSPPMENTWLLRAIPRRPSQPASRITWAPWRV